MAGAEPDRAELSRLVGATELLLSVAERVNGEIVDESTIANLYELRERAYSALLHFSERST